MFWVFLQIDVIIHSLSPEEIQMPIINGPTSDPQTRSSIGMYCRLFRTSEFKINTSEMSKLTNRPKQTIEAFESGKSTNVQHIVNYLAVCSDKEMQDRFLNGLNETFRNLATNK